MKCSCCGEDFQPTVHQIHAAKYKNTKVYCSKECNRVGRRSGRGRVKYCLVCGKEIYVRPAQDYKKICSKKCVGRYTQRLKKDSILRLNSLQGYITSICIK